MTGAHFDLGLNREKQLMACRSESQLIFEHLPLARFDIVLLGVMLIGNASTLLGSR